FDTALRAGDEILRGGDKLPEEFLRRRVEVREDRVDIVELALLHCQLRRAEAFLRSRDVDVRLSEALDELLDRDEPRRRRAGLLERDSLLLELPVPSPLGESMVDEADGIEDGPGATRLEVRLRLREFRGELTDVDAFALRVRDRRPRSLQGVSRLSVQRDSDAFDETLRRSEEMLRLFQGAASDGLFGRGEGVGRPAEDLRRGAAERFPRRGDVVLDAVEERVGLHQPAGLHRHRGIGELPFETDRVVLTRLAQGDNVVPRLEDPDVQSFLRLRVLVR